MIDDVREPQGVLYRIIGHLTHCCIRILRGLTLALAGRQSAVMYSGRPSEAAVALTGHDGERECKCLLIRKGQEIAVGFPILFPMLQDRFRELFPRLENGERAIPKVPKPSYYS